MSELRHRMRVAELKARIVQADRDRDAATRASDLSGFREAQQRLDSLLEELHALRPLGAS